MRVWSTIDRWGPGAISLLTLIVVIALGWQYSERIARIEGRQSVVSECVNDQAEINQKISSIQAKSIKDREDWEFAVAKLENFEKIMTRLLIKAGLME